MFLLWFATQCTLYTHKQLLHSMDAASCISSLSCTHMSSRFNIPPPPSQEISATMPRSRPPPPPSRVNPPTRSAAPPPPNRSHPPPPPMSRGGGSSSDSKLCCLLLSNPLSLITYFTLSCLLFVLTGDLENRFRFSDSLPSPDRWAPGPKIYPSRSRDAGTTSA